MTSLSRRKRQTTPQSTPPETATSGAQHVRDAYALAAGYQPETSSHREPLWVPAGLLAVLAVLLTALTAVGAEVSDSGWSSTLGKPSAKNTSPYQPAVSPARQARPVGNLRLVAFDAEVTRAQYGGQRGSATFKSVVVEEQGTWRGYRVAQEDDLLEGFEQPFGETPSSPIEQPELDEPTFGDPDLGPLPPLDERPADDEPSLVEPPVVIDPFEEEPGMTPSPSDDPGMELDDVRPEDIGLPAPEDSANSSRYKDAMKTCAEELAELKASRIAEIDLQIGLTGDAGEDYPFECGIDDGTPFVDRSWPQVCYMWKASGLCHKPLYFEDVSLERYGHSWGPFVQPFVSGAHFFARIPALPYAMGLKAPNECVYTLGHYRPGSCAPYLIDPIPMTWRAAAFQGAAVTGGVFLFP